MIPPCFPLLGFTLLVSFAKNSVFPRRGFTVLLLSWGTPYFHDEQDGYAELYLKENKQGWHKSKPVERFYVKYDSKNNLPTHKATLPNQRDK